MKPIIYSKKQCPECFKTKVYFSEIAGVEYEEQIIDPDTDPIADEFRALGYLSFPVVQYGPTLREAWSGHRVDLLQKLFPA